MVLYWVHPGHEVFWPSSIFPWHHLKPRPVTVLSVKLLTYIIRMWSIQLVFQTIVIYIFTSSYFWNRINFWLATWGESFAFMSNWKKKKKWKQSNNLLQYILPEHRFCFLYNLLQENQESMFMYITTGLQIFMTILMKFTCHHVWCNLRIITVIITLIIT